TRRCVAHEAEVVSGPADTVFPGHFTRIDTALVAAPTETQEAEVAALHLHLENRLTQAIAWHGKPALYLVGGVAFELEVDAALVATLPYTEQGVRYRGRHGKYIGNILPTGVHQRDVLRPVAC